LEPGFLVCADLALHALKFKASMTAAEVKQRLKKKKRKHDQRFFTVEECDFWTTSNALQASLRHLRTYLAVGDGEETEGEEEESESESGEESEGEEEDSESESGEEDINHSSHIKDNTAAGGSGGAGSSSSITKPSASSGSANDTHTHTHTSDPAYGQEVVGKRVEVYWPKDKKFYGGTITAFAARGGIHTVTYDDGDVEELNLSLENIKWG
jgi:hypothetical protein